MAAPVEAELNTILSDALIELDRVTDAIRSLHSQASISDQRHFDLTLACLDKGRQALLKRK